MTYGEIVYMVLDELKLSSDDASFTEDHVIFLAKKYRAFLLLKKYYMKKWFTFVTTESSGLSELNYQTICLDLIQVPAIDGSPCDGGCYLRSKEKIPVPLMIGSPIVWPMDYYQGEITFVSRDRMKYTGYNKWLQNIIYCSLTPDFYLYFKSPNPQFLYLEKVKFTAVFEDPEEAVSLTCDNDDADNSTCDIIDMTFPIEESLVPELIQSIVKELSGAALGINNDDKNNAKDDLPEQNKG